MFSARFWGVRGSIACPSPDHVLFGGNTSCVEVSIGERRFILDAGTGIRGLGKEFLKADVQTIHLLLTHTHWDHINGLPFFRPAYDAHRHVRVMAGHLKHLGGVQDALALQMHDPMFPVPLDAMKAIVEFLDFEAGDSFNLYPDVKIRTAPLRHPNGATGYRIEHNGKALCYVTDTEHVPDKPDENILALISGADVVIYDSTYTEEEFLDHVGWGHSTWNEGMRLCQRANADRLVIFHHEPDHDDAFMLGLEAEACRVRENAVVAREGMEIRLD